MESEKIIEIWTYILLILKLGILFLLARDVVLSIMGKKTKAEKDMKIKDTIENIFLVGVYLLLIYMFYPFGKKNKETPIVVSGHTKVILWATGIISLLHILPQMFGSSS
jgi:predicted transporter